MKWLTLFLSFYACLFGQFRVPVSQVARSNNAFALALYQEIIKEQPRNNLVFSPYSISAAMAIALLGAKEATEKDIRDSFIFPLRPVFLAESFKSMDKDFKTDNRLGSAHSLWIQEGLNVKDSFLEQVNKYFEGRFHQVDFEIRTDSTRNAINTWVSAQTTNKIPSLLNVSDLPRSTRMLLVASFTLQAGWETSFNLKDSSSSPFFIAPDKQRIATFMHAQREFPYYETEEVKIVEIPYAQKEGQRTRLGFWVILPKLPLDLKTVEQNLTIQKLTEWRTRAVKKIVSLKVPRFRLYQIHNFKEKLEKMGLKSPFNKDADFSNMTDTSEAMLSKIFQKVTFLINEKGSDALPQEVVPLLPAPPLTDPEGVQDFNANRPFLFFVLDNTLGQILFLGRLIQP